MQSNRVRNSQFLARVLPAIFGAIASGLIKAEPKKGQNLKDRFREASEKQGRSTGKRFRRGVAGAFGKCHNNPLAFG